MGRRRRAWFGRRAPSRDGLVYLVYGRADPGGAEPLIAVVDREEGARRLEAEVTARHPGARVMWEVHDVDGPSEDEVHVVVLGTSGSGDPATEEPDPIGVAVFRRRQEAERERDRRAAAERVPHHYVVRSLPVDWRRPGWPFEPES